MPTPNFNDLPDGSSSINHTREDWVNIDEAFLARHPVPAPPPPNPVGYSSEFPPHPSYADGSAPLVPPPPRTARARRNTRRNTRRGLTDPDAAIRKDPNAWSLREAVELCKLLEVVLPEAGFHIALTGGLLYKEGRRKDCDLMFYQIRQVDPSYEVLWKYLQVAGVIRSPSYPENGWLVKATYRGKAVDCLFPNAKKVKKVKKVGGVPYPVIPPTSLNTAVGSVAYPVPPPLPYDPEALTIAEAPACVQEEAFRSPTPREQALLRNAGIITAPTPILVRHNDGAPIIYRRSPSAPCPYDPAELLATPAPAPIPGDFENPAAIPEPPF